LEYRRSSFEKEFLLAPIHSPLSGHQSGPSLGLNGLHRCALRRQGEFAAGEVGERQANKLGDSSVRLTLRRLAPVVWPERGPASGGGEVEAAPPLRLGFR
jgi:hypothetical protein